MFDIYGIPPNMTPQAIFKGNTGTKVMGGGDVTYTQYRDRIISLLGQKSSVLIKADKPGSVNGKVTVNVTLTNSGKDKILETSLYAVIYKRVSLNGYNNVVLGITPAVAITSLAAGATVSYELQDDLLAYDNSYGVAVILKASSGLMIQALKAK